ncbi:efflux RND transporter periplasmic adaptor subunit [Mesorhizobium sp. LHD-90]|uniref:efflux RND transporter periplasmic adaptor subunit n=1 Tax=Mesorhizobium sp. LHD-90 TaxID=3071414 RepID=UPI0027E05BF6|nr:efflux RND transporter periplasmic adaptor subunit [Mesorhizobium sp. LHD-90]MDQ6434493.1 efflux RND transporter periplasmic adaptor subunit [Mesorhizobium sp. LHD-90]
MVRNTLHSAFAAILFAATMLAGVPAKSLAAGEEPAPAATQAPPAIRVITAERRELVETLAVNGTIVARDEAAAGTDLNGMIVTALNFDIGDVVKKGDVLAVLDRSMLDTQLQQMRATRAQGEASVAQMEAQIADAKVSVKQANEAYGRAEALRKKAVATQAELDNADNAAASARAKLDSAVKAMAATQAQLAVTDAQIRGIEVQIDKTEVRAPADGLVLARAATVGGVVSPSSGPLFRLAIGGEFELEASVAETSLPRLAVGMKSEVALPGIEQKIAGTIRRIAPEVDQKSRLGLIRIALPKDAPARAGSYARGEIELARREGVAVPVSAVLYQGETPLLQVVIDGRVATTPVKLGARARGNVEVVSGVKEGEEVVARAGTFVADGDLVTPVRADTTGAIAK